jgi:hypothetical protein
MSRRLACTAAALAAVSGLVVVLAAASSPAERPGVPAAAKAGAPHVVLLVLDEFPGDSLLDARGRIDPVRYPSFAALAADGTWFRNAYSSYDSTTKAVPLILDGRRPTKGSSPDPRSHPRSIFQALARRGYRTVSFEEATAICPPRLCRGAPARRPAIIPRLNRGREGRFERFVRSIRPASRPTLWVKHALLPHGPYLYLPSGARTRRGARDLVPRMNGVAGFHDPFLTRHNEQRYLLQLQFTDRLLGRLLRRIRRQGMYDRTLVVVTADHGFAWQVGVDTRRSVSPANVEELAPVPLIVKAPRQRRGRISRVYARTLDVMPTIADVLGVRLGYPVDGSSAFGREVRRRRSVSLTTRDFSAVVRLAGRRWEARRRMVVRRRLREFGSGASGLYTGIGPNRGLVGRRVAELATARSGGVRGILAAVGRQRSARRAGGVVPAQIAGDLVGGRGGGRRDLAVAVDGVIQAVGRSFRLRDDAREHFSMMVPEHLLGGGRHRVELFEVLDGRRIRLLARS